MNAIGSESKEKVSCLNTPSSAVTSVTHTHVHTHTHTQHMYTHMHTRTHTTHAHTHTHNTCTHTCTRAHSLLHCLHPGYSSVLGVSEGAAEEVLRCASPHLACTSRRHTNQHWECLCIYTANTVWD